MYWSKGHKNSKQLKSGPTKEKIGCRSKLTCFKNWFNHIAVYVQFFFKSTTNKIKCWTKQLRHCIIYMVTVLTLTKAVTKKQIELLFVFVINYFLEKSCDIKQKWNTRKTFYNRQGDSCISSHKDLNGRMNSSFYLIL